MSYVPKCNIISVSRSEAASTYMNPIDHHAEWADDLPRAQRRSATWTPPEHIDERMPSVSGNEVNGLGETEVRPPTPVMWDWSRPLAHAEMQNYISQRHQEHPEVRRTLRFRDEDDYQPIPVAADREEASGETWRRRIEQFAVEDSPTPVEDVGVAKVRPEWIYDGYEVDEAWVILLLVAMDYSELSKAPSWEAGAEVQRQYNRSTRAARDLADWLRSQGHPARGHGGPSAGPLLMLPAAIEAGLGELGKHGSLINRHYGSSFRLSAVLTDLDLESDHPDVFGADDFCAKCRICVEACPPNAILQEKVPVRGERKWYVDFDRCLPFFAETFSCGVCIAVCPWSKPGQSEKMIYNLSRKAEGRSGSATTASRETI